MKERPILFNAEMVRAILRKENPKTQTRRPMKAQPEDHNDPPAYREFLCVWAPEAADVWKIQDGECQTWQCPFGHRGDRLWVRETWCSLDEWLDGYSHDPPYTVIYRADESARYIRDERPGPPVDTYGLEPRHLKWKPSIHMPHWASRITLEVTRVWVERVQDISEEDINADGTTFPAPLIGIAFDGQPIESEWAGKDPWFFFSEDWDPIYKKRGYGWDANPWVWAGEFKRVE